uniref:Parathyroid hormone 2 receptor a n=1 Tax=Eptatretus burgeri TaxID=7764 RepID=A0A8C4QZP6_EPTBU
MSLDCIQKKKKKRHNGTSLSAEACLNVMICFTMLVIPRGAFYHFIVHPSTSVSRDIMSTQVDSDNVLTLEEQMYLLIQASWRCDSSIQDKLNHSDDGDCPPEWDGFVCWPSAKPGSVVTLPCPAYIFDFNHEGHVVRWCSDNGTWLIASQKNRTMVDYSQCEKVMPEGKEMEMYRRLSTIYTVGYSTTIISDIFALLLLAYFKRLHCTRNYIHMQLFVSFVLRGGSILVRDAILDPKITGGLEPGLGIRMNTTLLVLPESPTLLQLMKCKTCMFMFLYFLATNYFWMLVEGLYLHSLIFLTFYSRRQCFLWFFTVIGWVLPLVFVFSWAVVRATIADSRCWDMETDNNYEWIYEGPILFSVVVNFLLLLNIVRVIMIKLNQNNAGHQQASQRHRKLIKSTLALMMLFGTHYVVGFGYEHFRTTMLWKIGMYFEIFFSSFMVSMIHTSLSKRLPLHLNLHNVLQSFQ